ncbi:hypothetical protein M885DRAFT_526092 [Pelagophyceae sp. CCMP2097]|nr:hypothetical protein M885DRAFT_526092 [Pelagophyceae sp. CCMP2097]
MACFGTSFSELGASFAETAPSDVTSVLDEQPMWLDISPALWERALALDEAAFLALLRKRGERETLDFVTAHHSEFVRVRALVRAVFEAAPAVPPPAPPPAPPRPRARCFPTLSRPPPLSNKLPPPPPPSPRKSKKARRSPGSTLRTSKGFPGSTLKATLKTSSSTAGTRTLSLISGGSPKKQWH